MQVKKEVKIIEREILSYIANDGTEFANERDCRIYEQYSEKQKQQEGIKKLCVLEGYPPCDGGENYENRYYKWFLVHNENELEMINNCFGTDIVCVYYPEYVCVEHDEDLEGYSQTLTNCKNYVVKLFSKLGFDVDIKQNNYKSHKTPL